MDMTSGANLWTSDTMKLKTNDPGEGKFKEGYVQSLQTEVTHRHALLTVWNLERKGEIGFSSSDNQRREE